MLDRRRRFRVSVACGKSLSHKLSKKSGCVLQSPEMKLFLKVCIDISAQFWRWIPSRVSLLSTFLSAMKYFRGWDASLSRQWSFGRRPWSCNRRINLAYAYLIDSFFYLVLVLHGLSCCRSHRERICSCCRLLMGR